MNVTGGILKALKCSLFLLTYKWRNGRASLKTAGLLPDANHEILMRRDPPNLDENLDELTINELKDRLRDERLKVTGGKQELIDRLKERYTSMSEGSEYTAPVHVTVKQPDGSRKPIQTHDLEDAVKMLGFYYSLDAGKSQHVKEMVKKGIDWVDKMNIRKVPCRDAWMIFSHNFFLA